MKKKKKKDWSFVIKQTPCARASSFSSKEGKVKGHNNKLYLESMNFIEGHRNVLQ